MALLPLRATGLQQSHSMRLFLSTLCVSLTQPLIQIQLQLQPPDPTPAPTPDPTPAPEPEPAPAPAPTPAKKSVLPATGIADVVVPASVLAVSGLGFVAASRKVRK